MTNLPAISVVMPVYNVEAYVAEAIRSVLGQTMADFELIIVDDGGSDASMAICRGFADPRIRIIAQANRGLAGARNTGILAARARSISRPIRIWASASRRRASSMPLAGRCA